MKVLKREVQYFQQDRGPLYCIEDEGSYVFCLADYRWSVRIEEARELDQGQVLMNLRNQFQELSDEMIEQMKGMLEDIQS